MSDLDLDPGETDRVPKRSRIEEAVAAVAPDAAAGPVMTKRVYASSAGAERVPCACQHCAKTFLCGTHLNGTINKGNLRVHEKKCPKNPDRVVVSVRGKLVSEVFGRLESEAEFHAPEDVRVLTQGSKKPLVGAIHKFHDGSEHPVIGLQNSKPIMIPTFFLQGTRCCFPEDASMLLFRQRPNLFPKLYDETGQCFIAEIGTEQVEGAPEPWKTSQLRLISLKFGGTVDVFDIRCGKMIKMNVDSCARGQGPCRNCTGNNPDDILYERSFRYYLDLKELAWTTVPAADTISMNRMVDVQMTCPVCHTTWPRSPNNQVRQNSGCSGCDVRHHAELYAFDLYVFMSPDAVMYPRGLARIEGVHDNPYDIASTNVKIIVEIMSLKYHVEAGKLPNDTDKMLATLRDGRVYIMGHDDDYRKPPGLEFAWKRSMAHALRLAKADLTPRVIHVRCNATWDAYDCMRDAALAAEFSYQDIFCGDTNAYATERLPGETAQQQTILEHFK
jgi:hypothetical protein